MLLNFYNSFRPDKTIDHPILGEISCTGYHESFKKCQEIMAHKTNFSIQCHNLHEISMNCFRSSNEKEFTEWLDKRFEERKNLNKFLRENGSIQPRLQTRNMFYDIFITNAENEKPLSDSDTDKKVHEYYLEEMRKNSKFLEDELL